MTNPATATAIGYGPPTGTALKPLLSYSVFFLLFLGPKFGPIPLAKKYVFSPVLKENSPQNEVFKKKKSAKCDDSVLEVRINSYRALAMP